jgi:hypothetical protein
MLPSSYAVQRESGDNRPSIVCVRFVNIKCRFLRYRPTLHFQCQATSP